MQVAVTGEGEEGAGVLAEAGSAPAGAGAEIVRANAMVKADAFGHLGNIGAERLGEGGEFVDEGEFGDQEGIGGVFDEFGIDGLGGEDRCGGVGRRAACPLGRGEALVDDGVVQLEEGKKGAVVGRAEDDAVWVEHVGERRALAQEFGVGGRGDVGGGLALAKGLVDEKLEGVGGARRDGGLDGEGNVGVAGDGVGDLESDRTDGGNIGVAVWESRSGDGDEDDVGRSGSRGEMRGDADLGLVPEMREGGLMKGEVAVAEGMDEVLVAVDAGDVVAEVVKGDGGGEADAAGADDGYAHWSPPGC